MVKDKHLTKSNAAEIGRLGGIKSGEARRKRREMRQLLSDCLYQRIDKDGRTRLEAICDAAVLDALEHPSMQGLVLIMKLLGEYSEKVENTTEVSVKPRLFSLPTKFEDEAEYQEYQELKAVKEVKPELFRFGTMSEAMHEAKGEDKPVDGGTKSDAMHEAVHEAVEAEEVPVEAVVSVKPSLFE